MWKIIPLATILIFSLRRVSADDPGGLQLVHIENEEEEIDMNHGMKNDDLEDLLHASIRHSDPTRMKKLAKGYKESGKTISDVFGDDFIRDFMTDPTEKMQEIVNLALIDPAGEQTPQQRVELLDELVDFVSQIDNAINLNKIGGFRPLFHLFIGDEKNATIEERSIAGLVLGTALSNNEIVQATLLEEFPNALDKIFGMLYDTTADNQTTLSKKTAFCLSALLRNNLDLQETAGKDGRFKRLLSYFGDYVPPVASKVATLTTTIIQQQQAGGVHNSATLIEWFGREEVLMVKNIAEKTIFEENYSLDEALHVIEFLDVAAAIINDKDLSSDISKLHEEWKQSCIESLVSEEEWCSHFHTVNSELQPGQEEEL